MRYLVLSDIHSNMEALEAAVARAQRAGFDRVLCCGDIVGYGPDPLSTMDRVDDLQALTIRGNHDRVASGLDEPDHFSANARLAIEWTREQLPDNYRARLRTLPPGPCLLDGAQLVHGSLLDEDEYVLTEADAALDLALAESQLIFFGHTHIAGVFISDNSSTSQWTPRYDNAGLASFDLAEKKCMVNPGSVGQPRDGDWRTSFLIWDVGHRQLEFYRAQYPVDITQKKMRTAGLPDYLSQRLSFGR